MYVAKVVFDFLFFGASWVGQNISGRSLCAHMCVAKVVFDFLLCWLVAWDRK